MTKQHRQRDTLLVWSGIAVNPRRSGAHRYVTVATVSTPARVDECRVNCLSHLNPCEYEVIVLAEIDCFYCVFSHHGKLEEPELKTRLPLTDATTHLALRDNPLVEVSPV